MIIDAIILAAGFLLGYAFRSKKDSSLVDSLLAEIKALEVKLLTKKK